MNPEATKLIVKEARENRSVVQSSDQDELVKITYKLINEIREIAPQKSKFKLSPFYSLILLFIHLATRGISNYLMKKKAVLKRPRKTQKEYSAKFDRLRTEEDPNNRPKAGVGVKAKALSDLIEMEEEDKNNNMS